MPYIPHTEHDVSSMLKRMGIHDTTELFDEIPAHLRNSELKHIPSGLNEMEMLKEASALAGLNTQGLCFTGAGSYEHHIPAAVWDIASRGEFLTAYTPYQAEASQGTLQLLYEFQTMMTELTGMDVANASLYDGASALAEAVLMAIRINKHSQSGRILMAGTVHPFYRETVETIARTRHIELITLPFDEKTGITMTDCLDAYAKEDITALVIMQPNFFGCLETADDLVHWAEAHKAISIACVNPVSLGLIKPPGQWGSRGVDIVCGEGQPLGVPMASGGPYFGFFTTRMEYVRQMPGRLVGRTVDKDNKPGFALTLQAREQHIRRSKATSNICTNQGLLVTAATVHMALLGAKGLEAVARQCHHNTLSLVKSLSAVPGVKPVFSAPYFHEALLQVDEDVDWVINCLQEAGISGGYPAGRHYPHLKNTLLVCATEMRTGQDIVLYQHVLSQIMKQRGKP